MSPLLASTETTSSFAGFTHSAVIRAGPWSPLAKYLLQCGYVYLHAALNPSLLSSEVWVACGITPTHTMDERQCAADCGTMCNRNLMDW